MPHQPPDPDSPIHDELAAMRRIVAALQPLDRSARDRVVGWLFDRYRPAATPADLQEPTP